MNAHQRGVALISVLLIMSLALLITGALLRSHHLLLRSGGQQVSQLSLRQFALAGETWALSILAGVAQTRPKSVDMTQGWAFTDAALGIEGAEVRVGIEDLAGRLNLNPLLKTGQVDQVTLGRWERLQRRLDMQPMALQQVGVLRELSQLRLLPGLDRQRLLQLQPWVTLLPLEATLNVNTAPTPVLSTLLGVSIETAEALVSQRGTTPWRSVQAFTQDPMLAGAGVTSHGLGTTSRWFRITVQVVQGQAVLQLATDAEIDPESAQVSVVQRRLLAPTVYEVSR